MDKTFREFFESRNHMPFPTSGCEEMSVVMQRLADTVADWMDELASRLKPEDN